MLNGLGSGCGITHCAQSQAMKINRSSSITSPPTRRSERGGGAKSGSFSKTLSGAGETPAYGGVGGGVPVGPVDALLALQEVDSDDPGGRNQGRRRGEELLDSLDELRLGLLTGSLPLAMIERLASLAAAKRGQVDDPRLVEILNEIEVRAAVELAKLGR